jgi:hypothetical protein
MVLALEFPVLDADSHLFKTLDTLTSFIPNPSLEVAAGSRCHMASMDSRAVRRITCANMFDRLVLSTPNWRSPEHSAATLDS